MKALAIIVLLCSCGEPIPELEEGLYSVTLIETGDTCNWKNNEVSYVQWWISHIDDYYGIKMRSNGESLSCTQGAEEDNWQISCTKDEPQNVDNCIYQVVQTVVIVPEGKTFEGIFDLNLQSCTNETCFQTAVVKGELQLYY